MRGVPVPNGGRILTSLRARTVLGMLVAAAGAAAAAPADAKAEPGVRGAVEAYLAEPGRAESPHAPGLERLYAATGPEGGPSWAFTAAVYLWAAGIEGEVGAERTTVPVDVPFSELFDDLSGAFMGRFGARKGRWGALVDVVWTEIEADAPGPLGGTIEATTDLFIAEVTGSYRVVESGDVGKGQLMLDPYAGIRVCAGETRIRTALAGTERSETWVDPIVGLDGRCRVGRWQFGARADVGGFGISSDLAWSVTILVAFECSDLVGISAGYRWLDIDYETGGEPFYDAQLSGPFLAFVLSW